MSEYRPGTVAMVTYRGERVRAARIGSGWQMLEVVDGYSSWTSRDDVTNIRPLVVLDLDDPAFYANALRDALPCVVDDWDVQDAALSALADQIEAQTKPARIPEPGFDAKVKASLRKSGIVSEFLRYKSVDPDFRWTDGSETYRWSDLIDPVLVREGLPS